MDDDSDLTSKEVLDRAKSVLRLKARAARRAVLAEMRTAHAYAIAERVINLPELTGASAVALYGASPEEADPSVLEFALRELGMRIAYPRVEAPRSIEMCWVESDEVLSAGSFDLREPGPDAPAARPGELSVIVVPGVAFDLEGNRLGFGGGYYDALLTELEPLPPTIGIAYDEQIFDHVPHNGRDRAVDIVVTPTRVIRPTSRP